MLNEVRAGAGVMSAMNLAFQRKQMKKQLKSMLFKGTWTDLAELVMSTDEVRAKIVS